MNKNDNNNKKKNMVQILYFVLQFIVFYILIYPNINTLNFMNNNNRTLVILAEHTSDHCKQTLSSEGGGTRKLLKTTAKNLTSKTKN